ncbi:MAG TPA: hypothetical protein VGE52_02220 [Pirellulales bacterium]
MRVVRFFAFAAVAVACASFGSGCRSCCAPFDYNNPVPCAPNYSDSCARVNSRFSGGAMGEEVIYEGGEGVIYDEGTVYESAPAGTPTPAG